MKLIRNGPLWLRGRLHRFHDLRALGYGRSPDAEASASLTKSGEKIGEHS